MRWVVDTSALSAALRLEEPALAHLRGGRPGDFVLCTPVAAEIAYGLDRLEVGSRRRALLEAEYARLRAALAWEDWTEDAASAFGTRKARLERAGTPIGDMDVVIASVALARGWGVATRNPRHFERVEGLAVADWTVAPP